MYELSDIGIHEIFIRFLKSFMYRNKIVQDVKNYFSGARYGPLASCFILSAINVLFSWYFYDHVQVLSQYLS